MKGGGRSSDVSDSQKRNAHVSPPLLSGFRQHHVSAEEKGACLKEPRAAYYRPHKTRTDATFIVASQPVGHNTPTVAKGT